MNTSAPQTPGAETPSDSGPTDSSTSVGPGTKKIDGRITMPANSGIPSQTRLTKKSNGKRLARATSKMATYRSTRTPTEVAALAASTASTNMPTLARG